MLAVQVLNATRPSDFWLQVVAAGGMPATSPWPCSPLPHLWTHSWTVLSTMRP